MKALQRIVLSMPMILICICSMALFMSGCQLFTEKAITDPGPRYPDDMVKGEVFDVQVFRDSTVLRLTNTTTNDFGPSRVWLNQRYSQPIDGFASAQTIEMDLKLFVDEFGETYRAGGFFSQRIPAPVVLCQLETEMDGETKLIGFVVVENFMK